jgi:hypothetical protein
MLKDVKKEEQEKKTTKKKKNKKKTTKTTCSARVQLVRNREEHFDMAGFLRVPVRNPTFVNEGQKEATRKKKKKKKEEEKRKKEKEKKRRKHDVPSRFEALPFYKTSKCLVGVNK